MPRCGLPRKSNRNSIVANDAATQRYSWAAAAEQFLDSLRAAR
jgi:hypothetical protein